MRRRVDLATWLSKIWLKRSGWVGPPSEGGEHDAVVVGSSAEGEAFLDLGLAPGAQHGDGSGVEVDRAA
jgi:hypothetical protein